MFDRPRNWKWMVPGALVGPVFVWWTQWDAVGNCWAAVPLMLTVVLALAMVINLVLYGLDGYSRARSEEWATMNQTAEVRMFEAARSMHPEAVKALLVHRRTIWEMKYIPQKDVVDWTYREAPNLHAGFVDFVLDHSTDKGLMSKKLLSDGSKQFDPDGLVTDYEQYRALFLLLKAKLMITDPYGNQAPQWLPPWNVALVRHRFGLDGDAGEYDEDTKGKLVQAVVRAQGNADGRMRTAELPKSQSVMDKLPKKQPPSENEPKISSDDDGPDMTDEEWEAMQKVEEEEAKKYEGGVLPV